MEINRKEFLETLKRLSPAITQKEVISQSTDFIFSGEKIITYNGDLCISANFKTEFSGAINGKTLYNFLSSLKEDTFEITKTENNFILKSGKIKSKIKSKDIQSDYVNYEIEKFTEISSDLFSAIKMSLFSVSTDDGKFPLNCVYVNNDSVMTCDNIRASKIKIEPANTAFLIPHNIAKILIQYKDFASFYTEEGDKWLHLKTDNDIVYSFHMVFGDYPDLEFLFNPDSEGLIFEFPEELKGSIDSTVVFNDEILEIVAREGTVKCMSTGIDGTVYATIEHEIPGDIHFNINPVFLKEILSHGNECIIYDDTLLFSTDSFIHVLAKVID
jgi:DNA polymerase III sliding clamp (beta) subunit (PCNA family)